MNLAGKRMHGMQRPAIMENLCLVDRKQTEIIMTKCKQPQGNQQTAGKGQREDNRRFREMPPPSQHIGQTNKQKSGYNQSGYKLEISVRKETPKAHTLRKVGNPCSVDVSTEMKQESV